LTVGEFTFTMPRHLRRHLEGSESVSGENRGRQPVHRSIRGDRFLGRIDGLDHDHRPKRLSELDVCVWRINLPRSHVPERCCLRRHLIAYDPKQPVVSSTNRDVVCRWQLLVQL
jgi:hypothetical protein